MKEVANETFKVKVKKTGPIERSMIIRFPDEQIQQETSKKIEKYRKGAKLSGFRPGKVPLDIIKKRYGEQFRQEAISDFITSSYSEALDKEGLHPAGQPNIEVSPKNIKGFFSYTATFEIFPKIKLNPIQRLNIETLEAEITEADIDKMLTNIRNQKADWSEVQRKSKSGDRVTIDFVGKIEEVEFEGGRGEKAPIVIGEGQVIKDFDDALTNVSAQERKVSEVRFPKDYHQKDLAEKKAIFDINVHKIEEKVLPDLNKDFFSSIGIKEGGLEALRNQLQENAEKEIEQRKKSFSKDSAFEALLKSNKVIIPNALIERQILSLKEQSKEQKKEDTRSGEEYKAIAERQVRLGLLVQHIIEDQEIKVGEKEIDERISSLVLNYDKPEEIKSIYKGNSELMSQFESSILEEKVVEFLLNTAKVSKKNVKLDEIINY